AADRLARGPDLRDIDLMQLDPAVAVLDGARRVPGDDLRIAVAHQARIDVELMACGTTKQAMKRQSGKLSGDVPEGDVDARDAVEHRSVPAEDVQFLPEFALQWPDRRGVTADADRRDQRVERRL